jgi:hypothetical protein
MDLVPLVASAKHVRASGNGWLVVARQEQHKHLQRLEAMRARVERALDAARASTTSAS